MLNLIDELKESRLPLVICENCYIKVNVLKLI
jgi:hypothetical protein